MGRNKELVRRVLSLAVVRLGWCAAARRLAPKRGTIILYGHRISEDDEGYLPGIAPTLLERQIRYLRKHYEFISLSRLIDGLAGHQPAPHRSIVLTFDDGFADNYDQGLPIFKRYNIPATIFLTTGCISSGRLPWSQALGYVLQRTTQPEVFTKRHGSLRLSSPRARQVAYGEIKRDLRDAGVTVRESAIEALADQLRVPLPNNRMLTWDQAREMQRAGIEFGAHTVTHSLLGRMEESEARQEMADSLRHVRERLAIERPPFAFPGGSYSERLLQFAREIGFSGVFLSGLSRRLNSPLNASPFSMSRVGLIGGPAYLLEAELDGPFHALRRLYRG